jgi:hypothetical protein
MSYLKRNLALFGVNPEPFASLPRHYSTIVGKVVEVALKTSPSGFQATYFNKLVNAPASNGTGGGSGSGDPAATAPGISSLSPF